jgi:hypothetical protein
MSGNAAHRRPQRDVEIVAVAAVAKWVGSRGEVEDRGEGHDPDFWIDYADGTTAVGEVGWDEDQEIAAMWSATSRKASPQQIALPAGSGLWAVSLERGANIKALYDDLPGLILTLREAGLAELPIHGSWPIGPISETALALGVRRLSHTQRDSSNVAVFLLPGTAGIVPADPDVIVDWIDGLLQDPHYADATGKLLGITAAEKHVFFMAGSRTSYGVTELLMRVDTIMPIRAPLLPTHITHLWAMGRYGPAGAVLWQDGAWELTAAPPPLTP